MPSYDEDLAAWAEEQAGLLRAGRLDLVDAANVAEELNALARQEQRALADELVKLLVHLLLLQRGAGWAEANEAAICAARAGVGDVLRMSPSLRRQLEAPHPQWLDAVWLRAVAEVLAVATGTGALPESCPWPLSAVIEAGWTPS